MGIKTTPFDPADYLKSEDDIVEYIKVWFEDGTPQEITRALGDVARSKGMTEIARKAGLGRQALYTALSETGNPTLETLTAVLGALGLELTVQKRAA
ncbi:MAG: addiction module antidote protein [Novosphingobium sp.]